MTENEIPGYLSFQGVKGKLTAVKQSGFVVIEGVARIHTASIHWLPEARMKYFLGETVITNSYTHKHTHSYTHSYTHTHTHTHTHTNETYAATRERQIESMRRTVCRGQKPPKDWPAEEGILAKATTLQTVSKQWTDEEER